MADWRNGAPLFDADAILRKAWAGTWLLGLVLIALAAWGLARFPHWIWAAPIAAAVLALAANHRLRNADRRGEVVLLGVTTLLFVVISGVLLGVALPLARS
jgi:MFS superfamily sulfate permease-like transporter